MLCYIQNFQNIINLEKEILIYFPYNIKLYVKNDENIIYKKILEICKKKRIENLIIYTDKQMNFFNYNNKYVWLNYYILENEELDDMILNEKIDEIINEFN